MREAAQDASFRKLGPSTHLGVGDYVMLKGYDVPQEGFSKRFKHLTDKRLFQIHSVPGGDPSKARTFTLMFPTTGSTSFEFALPVAADRVIPVEVLPLTHPHGVRTRLRSCNREGEITATCVDGRVHLKWDGEVDSEVVDLSRLEGEFLT